ncbi:MAG TPA: flagellar biosynthetic protein FliR [Opitutaceae bacterium]|nr:flagellar biosynthetic protein FliR [Opitutaceae bacterium]
MTPLSASLLLTWPLIFLRAMGVLMLVPQMAGQSPPITVRLGLAACLATLLTGVVPTAQLPGSPFGLILAALGEVALGLGLGFVVQLTFAAVDFAGRLASSEIGLSGSPGMMTPSVATEPLAGFLSAFSVILFFAVGAHYWVLSAFARSFAFAHPGLAAFSPGTGEMLVLATARLIELGVRMAAPFLALNFLITLAFSVLGRAVPRIGVFVLSAPVRGLAGLGLFAGAGALIARYLYVEFSNMPVQMLQLVGSR